MPALNFPASSSSPWTAPNGVIYTWNTDGYWEAKADPNDFDTDYLKLNATNDPVTGNLALNQDLNVGDNLTIAGTSAFTGDVSAAANLAVTGTSDFTGLTTHAGGVNVTGGRVGIGTDDPNNQLHIKSNASLSRIKIETTANDQSADCAYFSNAGLVGVVGYSHLTDAMAIDSRTATGDIIFSRSGSQRLRFDEFGGIHNTVNDQSSFGINAAGSAPNYFAGKSTFGKTICVGPNGANDDNFPDGMSSSALRVYANASSSTDPKNAPIVVTGGKVLSSSPKHILTYLGGKTEVGGSIIAAASTGDLSFVNPSDYRLKTNIQSVTENASDKIKNLNVVSYTDRFGNLIPRGFVAHELQEECSEAVFGTKDATEAIGTLADYDGTELETGVVEPSAEELEYTEEVETDGVTTQTVRTRTWTATGTRAVYQGVDQTKLIPLLTKALQEALERIDALEAAAGG